jgi:hypothetical protein
MADEVVGTKCCARSLLNYSNLCEVQNCVKCAELEIQLEQVLNELNSVKLIIQMLYKQHAEEDAVKASIQQIEAEREVDESWKVETKRGTKIRTESKIKLRENDLIYSKEQTAVTANRYAALETIRNSLEMEIEGRLHMRIYHVP